MRTGARCWHRSQEKKMIDLAAIAIANAYQRWGWSDSAVAIIEPVVKATGLNFWRRAIHFKAARLQAMYLGGKGKYAESATILYKLVNRCRKVWDTLTTSAIAIDWFYRPGTGIPYSALIWLHRALKSLTHEHRFDMVRPAIYVKHWRSLFTDQSCWFCCMVCETSSRDCFGRTEPDDAGAGIAAAIKYLPQTGNLSDAETARWKEMVNIRNGQAIIYGWMITWRW